ncbi:hypothetical protein NKH77_42210 [Streptomyces sp. M19]
MDTAESPTQAGLWTVLGVLVLAAAAGSPDGCCTTARSGARGGRAQGGECVGVTDGGYAFSEELARVSAKIRKENDRVERSPAATGSPSPTPSP